MKIRHLSRGWAAAWGKCGEAVRGKSSTEPQLHVKTEVFEEQKSGSVQKCGSAVPKLAIVCGQGAVG